MDKKFVACNILDLVPSCPSLSSRVQVSCSNEEEDCEAGDPAFQPSARMPRSSLLLRLCGSSKMFKASHAVSFVEMKTQ